MKDIKINTEYATHKWIEVELFCRKHEVHGILDGSDEQQALYALFEKIEAMQATHAKAIEAAYREAFLDSRLDSERGLPLDEDDCWTESEARASLHKGYKNGD